MVSDAQNGVQPPFLKLRWKIGIFFIFFYFAVGIVVGVVLFIINSLSPLEPGEQVRLDYFPII